MKFNQIKPGMIFLTSVFSEIIVVLSVDLSTCNWLYLICLGGEENDIFELYGLPEDIFPHVKVT